MKSMLSRVGLLLAACGMLFHTNKHVSAAPVEISYPHGKLPVLSPFTASVNPYKVSRRGHGNQRQWRKWLRQNPHMRATKKAR